MNHWARFGRCFFQRQDYFIADTTKATELMDRLYANVETLAADSPEIDWADAFDYHDPIDESVSRNQGIRIFMQNGGRIVYRLSGTGTSGATLRVYLDKPEHDPALIQQEPGEALAELAVTAAQIASIESITGLASATAVIG